MQTPDGSACRGREVRVSSSSGKGRAGAGPGRGLGETAPSPCRETRPGGPLRTTVSAPTLSASVGCTSGRSQCSPGQMDVHTNGSSGSWQSGASASQALEGSERPERSAPRDQSHQVHQLVSEGRHASYAHGSPELRDRDVATTRSMPDPDRPASVAFTCAEGGPVHGRCPFGCNRRAAQRDGCLPQPARPLTAVRGEATMTGRTWLFHRRGDHFLSRGRSMSTAETIDVPHLGGSTIGYKFGRPYDASLPTLVMTTRSVPRWSYTGRSSPTSSSTPRRTCSRSSRTAMAGPARRTHSSPTGIGDRQPAGTRGARHPAGFRPGHVARGVGSGPHGHARTSGRAGHHPGWHVNGLREPAQPRGGLLGRHCLLHARHRRARAPVGGDWVIPTDLVDAVLREGFGEDVPPEERSFWHEEHQKNYTVTRGVSGSGSSPSTSAIATAWRPGWTACGAPSCGCRARPTGLYSVANAQEEIKLFVNSRDVELRVVDGGQHFLSATHPDEVNAATVEFIKRWT